MEFLGFTFWLCRGMVNYIRESFQELAENVTWTSRNEVQRLMIIVVVFSVLFSLFIWGVDLVIEKQIISRIL